MNREEIVEKVVSILEKNVEGLKLKEDQMDEYLTDLGVDSLGTMVMMLEVSEATGVAINDDQAEELDTPNKIVGFILEQDFH